MVGTTVALSVLGDWCEENYNESVAQWVRRGMKTPFPVPPSDFVRGVQERGMLPLLEDALEEAASSVPAGPSPNRPDECFTVACKGYAVVLEGRSFRCQRLAPDTLYSRQDVVKGPFERPSHAYLWMLVLQHQS